MKTRFPRLDNLAHEESTEISKSVLEAADIMVPDDIVQPAEKPARSQPTSLPAKLDDVLALDLQMLLAKVVTPDYYVYVPEKMKAQVKVNKAGSSSRKHLLKDALHDVQDMAKQRAVATDRHIS